MVMYRLGRLVFDVMMETGIEVQPVAIWEEEWAHPETIPIPSSYATLRAMVCESK